VATIRTTTSRVLSNHDDQPLEADSIGRFYQRHVAEDEHELTGVVSHRDGDGALVRLELTTTEETVV
jgi:hypothetical protein